MWANKLLRDCRGAVLIEFALIFPVVVLVTLGTVDMALLLYDFSAANKAATVGARAAIVSDPVATGITSLTYNPADLGVACFNPATQTSNNVCPSVSSTCTPGATGGSCTNGYTFDDTAFQGILSEMQKILPRLGRQNVQISYSTISTLGFSGRPGGLPMTVTVSIRCMTHPLFFLGVLSALLPAPPAGCPAGPAGFPMPSFATTLTSEDMVTN